MPPAAAHARPRAIAAALCAPALAACFTWQPAGAVDAALGRLDPRAPVRVLRTDGSTYTLTGVRVANDTLAGWLAPQGGLAARWVAVPVAQVRQVETRRVSPGRTVGAVVGGAALGTLLVLGAVILVYFTVGVD